LVRRERETGAMRLRRWAMPAAAIVLLLSAAWAAPAAAGDTAAPAAAEPKATWIPPLRTGDDDAYLQFYGQIDKGLLVFDDGGSTLGYGPVDNGNSSTRAGLLLYGKVNDDWSVGGNLEWEWTPYATVYVNQRNRGDFDWDSNQLRNAEVYLQSQTYGKLWLGQGSMASDGSAEVDLSGTKVVGYAMISDMAGGPFFRFADGTLTSIQVKDAFTDYDGLSRKLRIRYDTPQFYGFSLASSVGTQVVPTTTDVTVWDIAARYQQTLRDFEVSGALAYSQPADNQSLIDGSISILHQPSGLSLTVAAAYSDKETIEGRYGYFKLGYQTRIFEVGKTAFSADAYFGEDIDAADSTSQSFGVQLVQNLDYLQTELYLGGRSYSYDEPGRDIDRSYAVLAGARLKF
jgi:hypothetical protein